MVEAEKKALRQQSDALHEQSRTMQAPLSPNTAPITSLGLIPKSYLHPEDIAIHPSRART